MTAMTKSRPIITIARADAYLASALRLLMWLFDVMLRLTLSGRSARLQRLLSRAERAVECALFLRAVALYGPPPSRRPRPAWAPHGFRRNRRSAGAFFKSVGIRARKASVLERVFALIEALTHPSRAVAYFLKQICRGLRGSHLVAVCPSALLLASCAAIAPSCADCDTS